MFRRLIFFTGLIFLLGIVLGSCRLLDQATLRMTQPRRYPLSEELKKVVQHPELQGMKFRNFTFTTSDGVHLPVLIMEPYIGAHSLLENQRELEKEKITVSADVTKGTVLMLHGVNSKKEHMIWLAKWLTAAGYRCIAWDSRGHGDADVTKVTFGVKEKNDTEELFSELKKRGELSEPLFIYGHSMGAAVALQWLPQHSGEIKAAVLAAPFARLSEVMSFQAKKQMHGVLMPLVPLIKHDIKKEAAYDPNEINPVECVAGIDCPLLIFHGTQDQVTPINQSEKITAASHNPHSKLIITDGKHNSAISTGGTKYVAEMLRFLQNNTCGK